MEIKKIINTIEAFAPLDLQSSWDCSGWVIDNEPQPYVIVRQKSSPINNAITEAISPNVDKSPVGSDIHREVKKILLALTVDEEIVNQALAKGCDLIISHHPLFYIPFSFQKGISIYSAHTNLDVAKGGTTDTMISLLGLGTPTHCGEFLRTVESEQEILVEDFIKLVKNKLNIDSLKIVNKSNLKLVKKIAFCAGSGADFLNEAQQLNADVYVTGDIKFHTAFDSEIVLIDVGHFESERPVLSTLKELLTPLNVEVIIADEKSPFTFC